MAKKKYNTSYSSADALNGVEIVWIKSDTTGFLDDLTDYIRKYSFTALSSILDKIKEALTLHKMQNAYSTVTSYFHVTPNVITNSNSEEVFMQNSGILRSEYLTKMDEARENIAKYKAAIQANFIPKHVIVLQDSNAASEWDGWTWCGSGGIETDFRNKNIVGMVKSSTSIFPVNTLNKVKADSLSPVTLSTANGLYMERTE